MPDTDIELHTGRTARLFSDGSTEGVDVEEFGITIDVEDILESMREGTYSGFESRQHNDTFTISAHRDSGTDSE